MYTRSLLWETSESDDEDDGGGATIWKVNIFKMLANGSLGFCSLSFQFLLCALGSVLRARRTLISVRTCENTISLHTQIWGQIKYVCMDILNFRVGRHGTMVDVVSILRLIHTYTGNFSFVIEFKMTLFPLVHRHTALKGWTVCPLFVGLFSLKPYAKLIWFFGRCHVVRCYFHCAPSAGKHFRF